MTVKRKEYDATLAPAGYDNAEASAWASGVETGREEMLEEVIAWLRRTKNRACARNIADEVEAQFGSQTR